MINFADNFCAQCREFDIRHLYGMVTYRILTIMIINAQTISEVQLLKKYCFNENLMANINPGNGDDKSEGQEFLENFVE